MNYYEILSFGYNNKTLIEPIWNNTMDHGHTKYGSILEFKEKNIGERKRILADLYLDVLKSWHIIPTQVNHFFKLNYIHASNNFLKGLNLTNIETTDFKGKIIGFRPYINWLIQLNKKIYINESNAITQFLEIYELMGGELTTEKVEAPSKIKDLNTEGKSLEQLEYITRKEAAKILGISLKTLDKWADNGTIKAYRIASRIRYKKSEIENSLISLDSLRFGRGKKG